MTQYGTTTSTPFSRATYRSNQPRTDLVLTWVKDRVVLDLGCGMGYQRPDGLFYRLSEVASRIVGVEIDPTIVEAYRDQGYDVRLGDVQTPIVRDEPPGTFDVVYAGEIIEHLDNFAGFLDNVKFHLKPEGCLLLTTVNAFAFPEWLRAMINKKGRVHAEHTCWFDEVTLSHLLARHHLDIVGVSYVHHRGYMEFWKPHRLISRLIRMVLPDRVSWTGMVVVAKKA